jgi:hypothetical protein
MTLNEFKALAEIWGADTGRWPEHLRPAAAKLAATSEAAAILTDARGLDQLIIAATPQVSRDRIDRVTFNVSMTIADQALRLALAGPLSLRWWLIPAASIACAAVLGISLGLIRPLDTSRHRTVLTMVLDAGSFDPDWLLR